MKTWYLDHAATTPCHGEVWNAMRQAALVNFGNANSIHAMGLHARRAIRDARRRIAGCLGCDEDEVILTSGATESNNLAILGTVHASGEHGRHVITTAIEHDSVLGPCERLDAEGFDVTYLDVDRFGQVNPVQVLEALRPETALISIAHANNEIGTIQPLAAIATGVKSRRPDILIHTDAVQTAGHVPIGLNELAVDLLSFTAHKCYGPKGIGGLIVRRGVQLKPIIVASEQESSRPGTESVGLATGMAAALARACGSASAEAAYWTPVRDRIINGLLEIEASYLNGHAEQRLPTNANLSFDGVHGEDLVLRLDRLGIYTSTGSACTTGSVEPSHVITAIGRPRSLALGTLRLTLGEACRGLNVDRLVHHVREAVELLRSTSYRPQAASSTPALHLTG